MCIELGAPQKPGNMVSLFAVSIKMLQVVVSFAQNSSFGSFSTFVMHFKIRKKEMLKAMATMANRLAKLNLLLEIRFYGSAASRTGIRCSCCGLPMSVVATSQLRNCCCQIGIAFFFGRTFKPRVKCDTTY